MALQNGLIQDQAQLRDIVLKHLSALVQECRDAASLCSIDSAANPMSTPEGTVVSSSLLHVFADCINDVFLDVFAKACIVTAGAFRMSADKLAANDGPGNVDTPLDPSSLAANVPGGLATLNTMISAMDYLSGMTRLLPNTEPDIIQQEALSDRSQVSAEHSNEVEMGVSRHPDALIFEDFIHEASDFLIGDQASVMTGSLLGDESAGEEPFTQSISRGPEQIGGSERRRARQSLSLRFSLSSHLTTPLGGKSLARDTSDNETNIVSSPRFHFLA